jgi:hypothetical protein
MAPGSTTSVAAKVVPGQAVKANPAKAAAIRGETKFRTLSSFFWE